MSILRLPVTNEFMQTSEETGDSIEHKFTYLILEKHRYSNSRKFISQRAATRT